MIVAKLWGCIPIPQDFTAFLQLRRRDNESRLRFRGSSFFQAVDVGLGNEEFREVILVWICCH
jgi:hypothetical protein